ncbi:MAG: SRPBCC family protein [Bacteroidetes bacterium]|jgi:ligand-binding SRPBCC domain-containing protein|nr:SRPBCC family protein [Bacteroidota bacterium]
MAKLFTLQDSQRLPASAAELMDFFSVPENLARITPRHMRFEVVHSTTRPIQAGTVLTYRVHKYGLPMRWVSRIQAWVPNQYFVDIQEQGPFSHWVHRHELVPIAGGTEVRDLLQYQLPLGLLGRLGHSLFLAADIRRSFAYRKARMEEIFGTYTQG